MRGLRRFGETLTLSHTLPGCRSRFTKSSRKARSESKGLRTEFVLTLLRKYCREGWYDPTLYKDREAERELPAGWLLDAARELRHSSRRRCVLCRVRRIALEQYLTADAMGLGFEPTVPSPLCLCEGAISHRCVGGFKLPFFRLNLGQHGFQSDRVKGNSLLPEHRDGLAHIR